MASNNSLIGILIRAQDKFSGVFGKLNSQLDKTKTSAGSAKIALQSLNSALGFIGIASAAAALAKFGAESIKLGLDMQEVRGAFEDLAQGAGVNSTKMLNDLKRASRGMTSELDLIKTANRALLADSKVVIDNLGTVYEFAAFGADALGLSTTEAFDRVTKAMSSMQARSLKEFGINIDQAAAFDEYAKSIGKVSSQLTVAEQEIAFAQVALREMKGSLENSSSAGNSAADSLDILASKVTDLKTAIGEGFVTSGAIGSVDQLSKKIENTTNEIKITAAEWKFFRENVDASNINSLIFAFDEYVRIMQQSHGDTALAAQLLADYGSAAEPVPGKVDAVTDAVLGLNDALALSTRNLSAMAVFGTNLGGGFVPTNFLPPTSTVRQELDAGDRRASADAREREAEAVRRSAESQRIYNDRLREQTALLDSIRSRAESILGAGVNVTQQDMLDTAAGRYMDKPLEAARRLADIAAQGMASPWAKVLVPPPEVIAQGEAAVKAWAERTKQDVIDLTRPDLINWDAFVANYQDALNRESMKASTLDLAMSKLSEAGLLKGVDRNQVAQVLGIDTPQSTGELFASGFAEGLANKDMANLFLSAWQTDFDGAKSQYETAGKALGGVIITGLNTAVKDNIPGVRQSIAYYIAPEVAKILANKDGAKP